MGGVESERPDAITGFAARSINCFLLGPVLLASPGSKAKGREKQGAPRSQGNPKLTVEEQA